MSQNRATPGTTRAQARFAQIPSVEIQRSSFNRSCGHKTTFDAGLLVPIFLDEALPGDTMNMKLAAFARMSTPLYALMDNMFMDFFFFAVPNRLLWDNWQKMNGEQANPGDSTDFLVPQVSAPTGGYNELTLSDYMGLPTDVEITHTALFHRAYNLVWNEWFRDENLQDSQPVPKGDGPDDPANFKVMRRGKRHDYFTSCLPFPQKGPAVELPLGGTAPVTGDISGGGVPTFFRGTSATSDNLVGQRDQNNPLWSTTGPADTPAAVSWDDPSLNFINGQADLSSATAITVNALRESFQIQRMYERDARGGTRYTEVLRSHFGVISPDQRLQRPEYLGGGSTPMVVNPVSVTARISREPGEQVAYVTGQSNNIGFTKSFVEHCIIVGLVSVRADLNYQQGIDRQFSRRTRFDFFWPSLAHLGEQAVLNKEIFADGTSADDDVFGYQERYAEYRYKPSKITGRFRSTAGQSLDPWHLAQEFDSLPLLNSNFIEDDPPVERVLAVASEPHFIFDSWFDYRCARPMPTYSVPGLIDHF